LKRAEEAGKGEPDKSQPSKDAAPKEDKDLRRKVDGLEGSLTRVIDALGRVESAVAKREKDFEDLSKHCNSVQAAFDNHDGTFKIIAEKMKTFPNMDRLASVERTMADQTVAFDKLMTECATVKGDMAELQGRVNFNENRIKEQPVLTSADFAELAPGGRYRSRGNSYGESWRSPRDLCSPRGRPFARRYAQKPQETSNIGPGLDGVFDVDQTFMKTLETAESTPRPELLLLQDEHPDPCEGDPNTELLKPEICEKPPGSPDVVADKPPSDGQSDGQQTVASDRSRRPRKKANKKKKPKKVKKNRRKKKKKRDTSPSDSSPSDSSDPSSASSNSTSTSDSDSDSDDDGHRHMKKVRMPYFKGKGLDAFLIKFNAYLKSNRVPSVQRASHLMSACVGDVEALFDTKTAAKWSYKRIIKELQSRYGVTMAVGEMALALKEIKRKDGESLPVFHDRVKQLTKKAPLRSKQLAIEERNGFVEGLQADLALYLHVQHEDKKRDDISHALRIARHYEQTQGSAYKVLRDENKKVIEEMRNVQKELVHTAKSTRQNKMFSAVDTPQQGVDNNLQELLDQLLANAQRSGDVDVNSFTKLDTNLAKTEEARDIMTALNDWLDKLLKGLGRGQGYSRGQSTQFRSRGQRYTFGRGQRGQRGNFRARGNNRWQGQRQQSFNEFTPNSLEDFYQAVSETVAQFQGGPEEAEAPQQDTATEAVQDDGSGGACAPPQEE
jgi:hypothetical protein